MLCRYSTLVGCLLIDFVQQIRRTNQSEPRASVTQRYITITVVTDAFFVVFFFAFSTDKTRRTNDFRGVFAFIDSFSDNLLLSFYAFNVCFNIFCIITKSNGEKVDLRNAYFAKKWSYEINFLTLLPLYQLFVTLKIFCISFSRLFSQSMSGISIFWSLIIVL